MAAIPTTAWAVLDATMSYLRSRQNIAVRSIDDKIDRVLIYLEQMAYDRDKPFMLSECGLRVWAVDPLSVKDRMKRERRQPLVKVAMSPIHRRGSSSGLKWRVGMGVIGTSLQSSQPLLLDVDDLWKGLRSCSQQDWEDQDDHVRLGLTHEQFTRLCPSDPRYPLGPTILAVPYFSGDRPAGVCALDMSKAAAEALGIGGYIENAELRLIELMWALAEAALGKQST